MNIEQTLDAQLKDAMRAHDKAKVQCIRQVRSKMQEAMNAPGFAGKADDALLVQVIGSYVKQLEKSCGELAAGGERGEALVRQYRTEVDYLSRFLPTQLNEDELRALIAEKVAAMDAPNVRQGGKVLGALMKTHRGLIDVTRAKVLVDEALQAATQDAG